MTLALKKVGGQVTVSLERAAEIKERIKNISDLKRDILLNLYKSTSEIEEVMLAGAFYLEVSDIHLEPKEKETLLRVRIDGVLHDVLNISPRAYKALLNRFKVLSGLKLNITSKPQDGRFSLILEGTPIEIRTSSLPAEYGEGLVLRILNPKWVVSMEELGLRQDLLELFSREIKAPHGMIICTGPTGAGKTTTLYAFLQKINNPEIKIITIEDPIEYHLPGVEQTQVDESKGYTFANGLRAIVRQDPDVILVGEIRDLETAQIALQAALTGHLVFSTLHTNDAAGTVARLRALGEIPANIAPALNLAIGQRLVRKVCKKCVTFQKISPEIISEFKKAFSILDPNKVKIPQITKETLIPKIVGCQECNFTGYKGRIGIFEAFMVDEEMEQFILQDPPISAMKKRAIQKGMVPMRQDGFIKVLEGITSIEEVERVAGEVHPE